MKTKSGKLITPIEPAEPLEAFLADDAKPGDVTKIKAQQKKDKAGKYGSTKVPAFKPPSLKNKTDIKSENIEKNTQEDVKKDSWIAIELLDENNQAIAGEKYEVTLPDGSVASGTLDGLGVAKVSCFEQGNCIVRFPDLENDAWKMS